jgi:hypothetical protein
MCARARSALVDPEYALGDHGAVNPTAERAPIFGSIVLCVVAVAVMPERTEGSWLVDIAQAHHQAFQFTEAAMTLDVAVASGDYDADTSSWLAMRANGFREIARRLAHARHPATLNGEKARALREAEFLDESLGGDHTSRWHEISHEELFNCPRGDRYGQRPIVVERVRGAVGTFDDACRQVRQLGATDTMGR